MADAGNNTNNTMSCPLCGAHPIVDETCPKDCGSLEGLLDNDNILMTRRKASLFGYDWANGYVAPFLGILEEAAKEALEAASINKNDNVVDLGCGDGRICRIACELGAATADGYDLDEALVAKAKSLSADMTTCSKPSFYVEYLFQVSLDKYTVITMFLLPETTEKLVPKLREELSNNSMNCRIIAFGWPVKGLGTPTASYQDSTTKHDSNHVLDRWFLYTKESMDQQHEP